MSDIESTKNQQKDVENLQKILINRFENHPFAQYVGLKIESVQYQKATVSLRISERHLNANGTVHGGVLMTLADNAAGASVLYTGQVAPTIDLHYRFLQPVYPGDLAVAHAEVIQSGGSILVLQVKVTVNDDLVGVADTSFYRLKHNVSEIPKEVFDKAETFITEYIEKNR